MGDFKSERRWGHHSAAALGLGASTTKNGKFQAFDGTTIAKHPRVRRLPVHSAVNLAAVTGSSSGHDVIDGHSLAHDWRQPRAQLDICILEARRARSLEFKLNTDGRTDGHRKVGACKSCGGEQRGGC